MNFELKCRCCGNSFIFTEKEIEYYKEKGFKPPKKCPKCRKNPLSDVGYVSKDLGLSQQDIENNPQNHSGFFRAGTPKYEGFALNGCFILTTIEEKKYYLKIERMPKNTFSILFLESEDDASHFHKDVDIEFVKKLVNERISVSKKPFEVQSYTLEYSPRFVDEINIDELKKLKHLTEPMDVWRAKWHYEQCWNIHYYKRDINLSDF